MSRRLLAAAGLALVGGLGTALALDAATPAGAQAEVSVSAEQLRINQRISQAGVRRSNDALKRVAALEARAGVPGPAGPKGEAGDSAALVLTFFAPVSRPPVPGGPQPSLAPPGSVPQPVGLVGTEWPETGVARVTFNGPVHTCALSATVADDEGGEISAAIRSLTLPATTVEVRTRASDGTPAPRNFHLTVFCPR